MNGDGCTKPAKGGSNLTSTITEPYRRADIVVSAEDRMYERDECKNECTPAPLGCGEDSLGRKIEGKEIDISTVNFANEIKVDFIPSIDYRIMCRFLGLSVVTEVKNHPYSECPLITLMLMENLIDFMKKEGYAFAGELNFDRSGQSVPVDKTVWKIKNKEISFTSTGFMYFENIKKKDKQSNLIFYLSTILDHGSASITCFTNDEKKSERVIKDLEAYSKDYNCLRGAKIRDINMYGASFSEVAYREECTWDNYYYTDDVKDIFELEVFGFLKNVKQYNLHGITKRGLIIYGPPGTGKTTIGHILCNNLPDHTVIWITPEIIQENQHHSYSSIKLLYKLADFVSPSVIILEDLDLFSNDRERGGDMLGLGSLMNVLDGVNSIYNAVTLGTTNRLETIEKALTNRPGRFDRIVEISPLDDDLRRRMFENRLEEWEYEDEVLEHLIAKTGEWTGAESQEFINTLNLKLISSDNEDKKIDIELVNEIIEIMQKFGVGESSGKVLGFGQRDK